MKCAICKHGTPVPATTTVTLERGGATIVFKEVPALVCDNCGERYLDEEITSIVLQQARELVKNGTQVEIRTFTKEAA